MTNTATPIADAVQASPLAGAVTVSENCRCSTPDGGVRARLKHINDLAIAMRETHQQGDPT